MQTKIETYDKIAKDLKKSYPNLTEYETLSLAIQIERNQIIENGLVVSRNDSSPSGLEEIAMVLKIRD